MSSRRDRSHRRTRVPFRDLYFGLSDSKNEYNENPSGFVQSYYDINNIVEEVLSGRKTFVFGPKGTGKSALAYFVEATADDRDAVVSVMDASKLPLADIPSLQTGQSAGVDRTVTAWRFILLCNYLDLVQRDQSASLKNPREVARVTKLLRDFGFMGDASGRALLQSSTTTVSIPIPKLGPIYKKESKSSLNIYNLLPYLEGWAASVASGNRHVLFLDGLDSIFLNDPKYDESLAALVQASYLVNQQLRAASATGTVVLLLRNDVFSRISLRVPDSQKMRDDLGVELDWRILSGAAGENAPLMRLIDAKAASALASPVHVLNYFPNEITVGRNRRIPRLQYILNMTRHTPRDVLRLFEEVRKVEQTGQFPSAGNGALSDGTIREGILQYSTRYFVSAINNEFAGFEGGPEAARKGLAALQYIGKQQFTRKEFEAKLAEEGTAPINVDDLLRLFFYAGAIGNVVGNNSYMRFFHRRDDAEVYTHGQLVMHNALCHAWNIPFSL